MTKARDAAVNRALLSALTRVTGAITIRLSNFNPLPSSTLLKRVLSLLSFELFTVFFLLNEVLLLLVCCFIGMVFSTA